ncbi:MAG TPA: hypothetical protein VMU19_05205 [Bryobacteraceae bacterium]|nr:hypothetical protein [Bryobacteraceae bacterium]
MSQLTEAPMFPWLAEYETGVEPIDREHERLVATAEDMHRAMREGKGREALRRLLADLVRYAGFLVSWLKHHTMASDRLVAEHLRAQSAPLSIDAGRGKTGRRIYRPAPQAPIGDMTLPICRTPPRKS